MLHPFSAIPTAKLKIALVLVAFVLLCTAVFAVRGRARFTEIRPSERSALPAVQAPQHREASAFAVNRAELGHHVVRALDALGDRFESPGRARSTFNGTLTRYVSGTKVTTAAVIVREFPEKVRIEEQTSNGSRVLGYDGERPWSQSDSLSEQDAALVENIVRDSIDHFISSQANGDATFHLGDRFRMDDGSDSNYTGSFYDILKVDDTFLNTTGISSRPTHFYLNSNTGLLERIVYERQADGARVEVEFTEWLTSAGQKLPRRTTWRTGGVMAAEFVINQAVFAPSVNDGIFTAPRGR